MPPHIAWANNHQHVTPFGALVQWLLTERKLTQRDLAQKVGTAPSQLSTVLRGKAGAPSSSLVLQIIEFLQLNEEDSRHLAQSAELSATHYYLNGLPPWKFALTWRYHSMLPHLPRETGDIINLILQHKNLRDTTTGGTAIYE